MPWTETRVMDEKLRFIALFLARAQPMTVLCEQFGISRETGYELVRRYRAEGPAGLEPRSRAPHRPGRALAADQVAPILAVRRQYPFWGPRKIKALLERRHPERLWPAASTIGELLRREGLSEPRRRRRRALPVQAPFAAVTAANDTWSLDFKGWFRTADGRRCDPLTLSDAHSRFLLACEIIEPTTEPVRAVVERALRQYGLPRALRTDNGPPFAGAGPAGLTRLAVHWIKLGLRLERIDPGQPQQNGRHERLHGSLQRETTRPPAASVAEQQARFDTFRERYNHERPHEALGQTVPAAHYQPSPRPYPERLEEPWYDAEHAVRRVRSNGEIKWGGDLIFLSEALVGEPVGICETESGDWLVRFADVELGLLDRATKKLRRFAPARPGRRKADQTRNTVNHVTGL